MKKTTTKTPPALYRAAWLKGFRASIYDPEAGDVVPHDDAVAIAMGEDAGSAGIVDTPGEQRGYKAGAEYGSLVKKAYQAGFFPDLENALRGGNLIQVGTAGAVDAVTDFGSDPLGEIGDVLGISF